MFQYQKLSKFFLRVTRGDALGLHTHTVDRYSLGLRVTGQCRKDELLALQSGIVECVNVDRTRYPDVELPRYMLPIGQLFVQDYREPGIKKTYWTNFTVMLDATNFKAVWIIWRRPVIPSPYPEFQDPRETFWMAKRPFGIFRWLEDIGDWLDFRCVRELFGITEARDMLRREQREFEHDLVNAPEFVGAPIFTTPIWEELCEAIAMETERGD